MKTGKSIVAAFLAVFLALPVGAGGATQGNKKKKKPRKSYYYEHSKYRAFGDRVNPKESYRFDERGNPIVAGARKPKKKPAHHKKSSQKPKNSEVAQKSP